MVANYTASKKKRSSDDYTPGGVNDRRPDRATIVYTNLIRRYLQEHRARSCWAGSRPACAGWRTTISGATALRRSILFDAKADYLLYGMAEQSVLELARALQDGGDATPICAGCATSPKSRPPGYLELPSLRDGRGGQAGLHRHVPHSSTATTTRSPRAGLCQHHGDRCLVQNPPAHIPTQAETGRRLLPCPSSAPSTPITSAGAGESAGDDPLFDHHPPRLLRRVQLLRHRRARRAHGALAQPGVRSWPRRRR